MLLGFRVKGGLSGWTDFSLFLFLCLFCFVVFRLKIHCCHFHEAWPSPRHFHFFVLKWGLSFPLSGSLGSRHLSRPRDCLSNLSVQLLLSNQLFCFWSTRVCLPHWRPSLRPVRATCPHVTLLSRGVKLLILLFFNLFFRSFLLSEHWCFSDCNSNGSSGLNSSLWA